MTVHILNKYNHSWFFDDIYRSFELSKTLYVYHSQSIKISNHSIPEHIIEEVNSDKAFLIVSEDSELSNWFYLRNKLDLSKIKAKNNCIILSSNLLFNTKNNSLIKDDCPFKVFFVNGVIAETVKLFKSSVTSPVSKYYTFLSYRHDPMRSYFYYLLKTNNLLEKGVVSHNNVKLRDRPVNANINSYLKTRLSKPEFTQFEQISNEIISLDDAAALKLTGGVKICYYNPPISSVLEVVAETSYDLGYNIYSEKIFKAILNKNIFLLLGNFHTLGVLQKFGFKTFSHLFDESYDNMIDPIKRFDSVFQQLNNFCSLSLEEVIKIKNDNQDILDYNYNHLVNNLDLTFNLKHKVESYFKENENGRN